MAPERSQQPLAALDRAGFVHLYDECLPQVYAYVGSRVEDRAAAEEITAAAFQRAVEVTREEGLDGPGFASVVFRVAATAVVDHARRSRGAYPRGVRAADFDRATDARRSAQAATDDNAARAFTAAIDRRALRRGVQRLSEAHRRLIVLRYLDALGVDEQCAVLGWSRDTLARRIHGALRSLHSALIQEVGDAA
jgi:RNA polymerase sigma-70 factor (ECF subfamily)